MKLHKNYIINSTQSEYLLEMFESCYPDMIEKGFNIHMNDSNKLFYHSNQESLDWLMVSCLICDKLLADKHYWINRFYTCCFQIKSEHPVDFLFEVFSKNKLGESLFKKTENQFVLDNEKRANKKEENQRVKKEKDKVKKKEEQIETKSKSNKQEKEIDEFFD